MVPTDVPLGELMPDFLDVTRLPDHDGWEIGPAAGDPYKDEQKTLAELGVGDGTCSCCTNRRAARATHRAEPPPRRGRQAGARHGRRSPATGERPLRERTVKHAAAEALASRPLPDRGARADGRTARRRAARRRDPRPGDVHPSGAGLAAGPGARGVGAVGLPVPARRADRRPAAAFLRDDRGRVSQGRGRQEHGHRAAGIATGVPAPRPSRGRGDQPGLGVARPTASTRPPDLHRRPARRTAERRTNCRRQVSTRTWAAARTG